MIWFPGIPYAIIQAIIKTKASMAFADDKKLTDSNRGQKKDDQHVLESDLRKKTFLAEQCEGTRETLTEGLDKDLLVQVYV